MFWLLHFPSNFILDIVAVSLEDPLPYTKASEKIKMNLFNNT
jgi:hypothetical protein